MICEFMGQAEDLAQDTVVSAVNSQVKKFRFLTFFLHIEILN